MKEAISQRLENEKEVFREKSKESFHKQTELLFFKQESELKALWLKAEKAIGQKMRERDNEREKLLRSMKNAQKELIQQQNLQFSKIQAKNAKTFAKYKIDLCKFKQDGKAFLDQLSTKLNESMKNEEWTKLRETNQSKQRLTYDSFNVQPTLKSKAENTKKKECSKEKKKQNSKFEITLLEREGNGNNPKSNS